MFSRMLTPIGARAGLLVICLALLAAGNVGF